MSKIIAAPGLLKLAKRLAALISAACLALMLLIVGPANASSTRWRLMPTPANDNVTLNAVSCTSETQCVAVGYNYNHISGDSTPAADLWKGAAWTAVTPPADATQMLGVACPAASYCIAVGYENTDNGLESTAQAWSWNGAAWSGMTVFNPGSILNGLTAITCAGPSNCEAVGYHGVGFSYPLAEFWNGKTWANQSTSGTPPGSLSAVACITTSKCEAVGSNYYTGQALALRLNGSKWVSQAMPALPPPSLEGQPDESGLGGISCYAAGCTAVGWQGDDGDITDNLAEVYNGTRWALQSPVGSGDGTLWYSQWDAVHCVSAANCTAIGYTSENNDFGGDYYTHLTLAGTWNGTAWTVDTTPDPGSTVDEGTYDVLDGLSCTSAICTAVGNNAFNGGNHSTASLAIRN